MKIKKKEQLIAHPLKKALAVSLSALMAGFVFSATASYASDIEIYQQARSGNISLMFVLDISGSMRYFDANNQELTSCSGGASETTFTDSANVRLAVVNTITCVLAVIIIENGIVVEEVQLGVSP